MDDQGIGQAATYHQGGWSGGRCPYCGGSDIVTGLEFSLGTEVGPFGLTYKALAVFRGSEKVHADLCNTCGTIVRLFVTNTKRVWTQRGEKKN
jgi:hypothetical protein